MLGGCGSDLKVDSANPLCNSSDGEERLPYPIMLSSGSAGIHLHLKENIWRGTAPFGFCNRASLLHVKI
jgi:hypothetical protein